MQISFVCPLCFQDALRLKENIYDSNRVVLIHFLFLCYFLILEINNESISYSTLVCLTLSIFPLFWELIIKSILQNNCIKSGMSLLNVEICRYKTALLNPGNIWHNADIPWAQEITWLIFFYISCSICILSHHHFVIESSF